MLQHEASTRQLSANEVSIAQGQPGKQVFHSLPDKVTHYKADFWLVPTVK